MIGHPPAEDRPFRLRAVPCGTKAQGRAIRLAAAPVHHQARADALDAPLELTGPVPAQGRIMFPCAAYPAGGNGARTAPQGVVGPLKTPISATHTGRHGSLCGGLWHGSVAAGFKGRAFGASAAVRHSAWPFLPSDRAVKMPLANGPTRR